MVKWAGGPLAVVDCFGILADDKIRRYFELGCEVKGLGRGHIQRIKEEVTRQDAAMRGRSRSHGGSVPCRESVPPRIAARLEINGTRSVAAQVPCKNESRDWVPRSCGRGSQAADQGRAPLLGCGVVLAQPLTMWTSTSTRISG